MKTCLFYYRTTLRCQHTTGHHFHWSSYTRRILFGTENSSLEFTLGGEFSTTTTSCYTDSSQFESCFRCRSRTQSRSRRVYYGFHTGRAANFCPTKHASTSAGNQSRIRSLSGTTLPQLPLPSDETHRKKDHRYLSTSAVSYYRK